MKAIRGAITVDKDRPELIKNAVSELLSEIKAKNGLNVENVISITFSSTADLRSYYPAKAAREAGFSSFALFSVQEPKIKGALKKCIRVLIYAETDKAPVHVYLGGAKILRRDITERINIALDGPAGSGKSTVSKLIAKKLGILCLDTGAMYRACALQCLRSGIDGKDENAVKSVIEGINIEVKHENGVQRTFLNGADVSEEIRKPQISLLASDVAALGCVREKMVEIQRKIAENTSCILDGRDIGTKVLPNAKYKFFLTASSEVRAKRRFDELIEKGHKVDLEELKKEIEKRDEQDKTRAISPLLQAEDAIFVDSSYMGIEEVADFIISKIQEKI